jgi:cysteine synthase
MTLTGALITANGTADEIWRQTVGRVTHFTAMLGTSGTFVGTSRRLKELNPGIRCISLQPDSPFHGIEGTKHMETSIIPSNLRSQASPTPSWASTQKRPTR